MNAQNLKSMSLAVGTLGVFAFLLEWGAAFGGVVQSPPGFWLDNAKVLFLAAIWLKLGAIYHKN